MKTSLHGPYLTLLAALGLELACVGRVGGNDGGESQSGSEDASTTDPDGGSEAGTTAGTSASSSTGDGDGDTGTQDTGPPPDPFTCENPTPIMQAGTQEPSGFVLCEGGFIHREEAVTCVEPLGPDSPNCAMGGFGCMTGADCIDDTFGSCVEDILFGGCFCHYGCETDADCGDGQICACAGVAGPSASCIPAGCTISDDCGDGLCGLSTFQGCCGDSHSLACASPTDECHTDADCGLDLCDPNWPEGGEVMHHCTASGEPGFTCEPPEWCSCDCGRPFFVEGEARTAPVVTRADWLAPCELELAGLDAATRERLAVYWAEIARFEQASVASFARAAMQLMQLGAPPRLLLDTQRAQAEEIEHARLAFGLASAYAGEPLGPGGLDVSAALAGSNHVGEGLGAIVDGLIVEACVGETLAALEAREAAAQAQDARVREVLTAIASDELRHAALGWRTLRWILDRGDATLTARAIATLDAAIAGVASTPASFGLGPSLRRHGVLDDALREQVRRAGLEQVVMPCVEALRSRHGAHVSAMASRAAS